jgi:putative endonuclease
MPRSDAQDKSLKNKKLGDIGEEAAAGHLSQQGFRIEARNVRFKGGEIDIVASRGGELHFIEVRTRSDASFVNPVETITEPKKRRIRRAATLYLMSRCPREGDWPPCHFDVIGIDLTADGCRIECIFDAFE